MPDEGANPPARDAVPDSAAAETEAASDIISRASSARRQHEAASPLDGPRAERRLIPMVHRQSSQPTARKTAP
jgi:hypothetical protein